MNDNYYLIKNIIETHKNILREILPCDVFIKELEIIKDAEDYFEQIAIDDHCKIEG